MRYLALSIALMIDKLQINYGMCLHIIRTDISYVLYKISYKICVGMMTNSYLKTSTHHSRAHN